MPKRIRLSVFVVRARRAAWELSEGPEVVTASPTQSSFTELLPLLARVWGEEHLQPLVTFPGQLVEAQPGLGLRVRERRIGRGMSIVEAAYRAGVAPRTWQRIETGEHMPWSWQLVRVSRVLGTSSLALAG